MKRELLTIASLTAASLLAGCGGSSPEKLPSTSTTALAANRNCHDQAPPDWSPTPSNLNVDRIAAMLGVSADQIVHGTIGHLTCTETFRGQDVGSRVTVDTIGKTCLLIGLGGEWSPTHDVPTQQILAVCPETGPAA